MILLWLIPLSVVCVDATYIGVVGELICPNPVSTFASIFLMVRDPAILDFFDKDDMLDFKRIELNKPFEIGGSQFEIFGLEPYIYLKYSCQEDYKEEVIDLGNNLFRDRVFHLRKNLVSGETILT